MPRSLIERRRLRVSRRWYGGLVSKRSEVNMVVSGEWSPEISGPTQRPVAGPDQGAVQRTREVVGLLERVLQSMVDDNEIHPAVEHVYATLCEAEIRGAAPSRPCGWSRR